MSERAENNFRLELYRELDDIVSAMKNLAQVELHRVSKAEATQAGAWQTTATAFQLLRTQMTAELDTESGLSNRVLLLIGSERGFCGGFNEQLMRLFGETDIENARVLVLGSRLSNKLPPELITQAFPGPSTADEILPCMQSLMDYLLQQPLPRDLNVLSHGPQGLVWQSLLPVPAGLPEVKPTQLQTNLPAKELLCSLQWQVVQQGVLRLLLVSLKNENRHRLQQMEGAREHLEELTRVLRLRINALRQQEIVEEIEVILADQTWA